MLQGDAAIQTVQDILASASSGEEPAVPDELSRLHEVLDAGGAEALFRNKALMQALADLAGADPAGFAAVRASIRERVSVRDLDKALRSFRRSAPPGEGVEAPAYFEQDGCIFRNTQTKDGPVPVALCNFSARIVEDVVHDDGAEQTRSLAVQGALACGSPLQRAEVPAADFGGMGWVVPAWGTRAVVFAGMGTKDHLRAALQLLSGDVPPRTIFRHVGWRKVGDAWVYLHAGGAIGADDLADDLPVSLPEPMAAYHLPAPSEGSDLQHAIRASLGMLQLGPERATFSILSGVYRAVLGDTDFGLHMAGPTGCFKSEVAALAQQHFGPGMDARHLPANWSSTGNALEALAFTAKDALLVVDDFCPTGSAADVQRYHREADRLFRGQGNRAGRQRMRADASLRPSKPPRGLTLSTGEDTPRGQSLRARMFVLEVSPGDFGPLPPIPHPTLSACQRDAAAGKYAAALAGGLRRAHVRKGEIAHPRKYAVGAHRVQRIHGQPQPHRDVQFAHTRLHDPVQHRAHDPAGGGQTFLDHRFVKIVEMRAVEAEQPGLAGYRAFALDVLQHPQPAIGAQRRPGDGDARAIDAPVGIDVDQFDRHPAFRQADRGGHTADAADDDERVAECCNSLRFDPADLAKPAATPKSNRWMDAHR